MTNSSYEKVLTENEDCKENDTDAAPDVADVDTTLSDLKNRLSPPEPLLEAAFARLREKLRYELRYIREEKQNVVPTVAVAKIVNNNGAIPKFVAKQVRR